MIPEEKIYIVGSGVVGFPLAAYLTNTGRKVVAVRTSRNDAEIVSSRWFICPGLSVTVCRLGGRRTGSVVQ